MVESVLSITDGGVGLELARKPVIRDFIMALVSCSGCGHIVIFLADAALSLPVAVFCVVEQIIVFGGEVKILDVDVDFSVAFIFSYGVLTLGSVAGGTTTVVVLFVVEDATDLFC